MKFLKLRYHDVELWKNIYFTLLAIEETQDLVLCKCIHAKIFCTRLSKQFTTICMFSHRIYLELSRLFGSTGCLVVWIILTLRRRIERYTCYRSSALALEFTHDHLMVSIHALFLNPKDRHLLWLCLLKFLCGKNSRSQFFYMQDGALCSVYDKRLCFVELH